MEARKRFLIVVSLLVIIIVVPVLAKVNSERQISVVLEAPSGALLFEEEVFGIAWGTPEELIDKELRHRLFPRTDYWKLWSQTTCGGDGRPIVGHAGFWKDVNPFITLLFLDREEPPSGLYAVYRTYYDPVEIHLLLADLYRNYAEKVSRFVSDDTLTYEIHAKDVSIKMTQPLRPHPAVPGARGEERETELAYLVVTWKPAFDVAEALPRVKEVH